MHQKLAYSNPISKFLYWGKIMLRGLGQIMLQENGITGLLFLAGICIGSWQMGLAALISTSTGTICARLLGFEQDEIERGLYGFSAALTGVAFALFFKSGAVLWGMIVVGAGLASLLQHFFIQKKIPAFTLPFVVVTWLALWIVGAAFPGMLHPATTGGHPATWAFAFRSFGEVIFQNSIWSGGLFLIAVCIHSLRAAMLGLLGAIIAAVVAWGCQAPPEAIAAGLFSYNAVLCAIALCGQNTHDLLWAFCAVVLSVLIQMLLLRLNIPVLTFPFVAATMMSIGLRRAIAFLKKNHPDSGY